MEFRLLHDVHAGATGLTRARDTRIVRRTSTKPLGRNRPTLAKQALGRPGAAKKHLPVRQERRARLREHRWKLPND